MQEYTPHTLLDTAEQSRIAEKIRVLESGTSAEVVTVVAERSDDYRYIPLLWAALIALAIPGLYFLWHHWFARGWNESASPSFWHDHVYGIQVLVFFGLAMLFQWEPLRIRLVPGKVRHARAGRFAESQFLRQGLHRTRDKCGLLLFVSAAEHHVEIIVDDGIANRIDNSVWEQALAEFVSEVRAGRIAEGFERTLDAIQEQLWTHFPALGDNPNELPDHLVIISADD